MISQRKKSRKRARQAHKHGKTHAGIHTFGAGGRRGAISQFLKKEGRKTDWK